MPLRFCLTFAVLLAVGASSFAVGDPTVTVSSLAELAQAAVESGQQVKMKPGVYKFTDFISLAEAAERRKRQEWHDLDFSGSNSSFDLTGVTIELDTAIREKLHAPMHTDEFVVTGSHVSLKGLTITCVGDGKADHGAVLGITGTGDTLLDCTVHVRGSAPYGYGDLFGKGGMKHCGVHITGSGTRILGCKVFNKSFGHGFYLQEDCNDVLFDDCHVEGVMRTTDDILKETSGLAFQKQFQMVMKNRDGEPRILPGYMKALSEDGFRTYGTHKNVVLKNCTVKNMRGGFELRTKTAPRLENCTATGCERGFWVSDGATIDHCQGDAQYGPLLYVEGDKATVNLTLLPAEDDKVHVHALAAIYGKNNNVTLTTSQPRAHPLPILIGFGPPGMGENMAPHSEKRTQGLTLDNRTAMPVIIGANASKCHLSTDGPVLENKGKDIEVRTIKP